MTSELACKGNIKRNMDPTPTKNNLPLRKGDFTNLAEALDYAAQGNTGYNFYDGAGKLRASLPYKKLRKEARSLARRLLGLGPRPGARVALVADTHPDFMRYFFACQYAGLVPIPLPAPIQLGDRRNYVEQLRKLLVTCKAEIAVASEAHLSFLMKAAASLDLSFYGGTRAFVHLPEVDAQLKPAGANDLAYLQFTTSGKLSRSQARKDYQSRMAGSQSVRVCRANQLPTVKQVA